MIAKSFELELSLIKLAFRIEGSKTGEPEELQTPTLNENNAS